MARKVLAQDQAQASQAEGIEAQRQYEKDLSQYEKELEEYEKNKAALEEADKKEKEALEKVKQKEIARLEAERKARADEEKRINDAINAYREQYFRRYPGSKGSSANVAINKYAFKLRGGSEAQWNALRREEERNRKISQRQSAGLRASGNAAIKAAQQAELARLGGGSTSGPTKVSSTLGSSGKIADLSAPGVAAKAQDFGKGFTYETRFYGYSTTGQAEIERIQKVAEYERQQANQATINRLGLSHDVEQLNKQGVSSLYNAGVLQVPEPPKQVNTRPLANKPQENVSVKNKVAPYLIPIAERSKIGYAPDGKPYVGASQPQGRWAVETKDGKVRVFKDWNTAQKFSQRIEKPRYQVTSLQWSQQPVGVIPIEKVRTFKDLETAEKFTQRTSKGQTASGESFESYWVVPTKQGEQQFATKEEAEKFIKTEQDKLPYTDAKILPLENLYSYVDKRNVELKKAAEERPHDLPIQLASAVGSTAGSTLNAITYAGDWLDKNVLKQEQKEKKFVTLPVETYYDRGIFGVTSTIDLKREAPFVAFTEDPIKKGLSEAQDQWNKNTPTQNVAQTIVGGTILAVDIATLGKGGLSAISPIKYIPKKVIKVPNKITGKVEEVTTEGAKIRPQVPPITYQIAKVQPIRRVQPKILTAAGEVQPSLTHWQIGYGRARIDLGGKYKEGGFYKGKPTDFEQSGLGTQRGSLYTSSFDTHQLSHYTQPEIKILDPLVRKGEDIGRFEKGRWETLLQERRTAILQAKERRTIDYHKTIPRRLLTQIHEGILDTPAWMRFSTAQGKNWITRGKGSGTLNLVKGGWSTKVGDVDVGAVSDIGGLKAADYLARTPAKKGYAYQTLPGKTNVFIGEIDESRPIWNLYGYAEPKKGIFVRGTNLFRAKQLESKPAKFKDSPRGLLWSSDSPRIAKQFAKKAVRDEGSKEARVAVELDIDQLYDIRNAPKGTRKEFESFFEKGRDDWRGSQDYLEQLARQEDKAGYIKPYKSLSKDAPIEAVVFDPKGIKNVENIPPTSYGIKNPKEVFNIVSGEEELTSAIGADTGKFYGKDVKTGEIKIGIDSKTKKKVVWQDLSQQSVDLKGSSSGIIDRKTLREWKDHTPELEAKMFPPGVDVKYGVGLPHRMVKDLTRSYMTDREFARSLWKAGKKKEAKQVGKSMGLRWQQERPWLDWRKAIKEHRDEGSLEINFREEPALPPESPIVKHSPKTAIVIDNAGRIVTPPPGERIDNAVTQSKSITPVSAKIQTIPRKSMASISKSPKLKGVSPKSPKTFSPKSPKIASPKSLKLQSAKSSRIQSPRSPKSPKVSSPKSPISPRSPKSPKSPISPKIISPKSPRPVSPKSPKSPKSPASARSALSPALHPVISTKLITKKRGVVGLGQFDSTKKKGRQERNRTFGFLGNTRLDKIEGLFKRETIIYGDRKIEKQIRKDKKAKFKEREVKFFSGS